MFTYETVTGLMVEQLPFTVPQLQSLTSTDNPFANTVTLLHKALAENIVSIGGKKIEAVTDLYNVSSYDLLYAFYKGIHVTYGSPATRELMAKVNKVPVSFEYDSSIWSSVEYPFTRLPNFKVDTFEEYVNKSVVTHKFRDGSIKFALKTAMVDAVQSKSSTFDAFTLDIPFRNFKLVHEGGEKTFIPTTPLDYADLKRIVRLYEPVGDLFPTTATVNGVEVPLLECSGFLA